MSWPTSQAASPWAEEDEEEGKGRTFSWVQAGLEAHRTTLGWRRD